MGKGAFAKKRYGMKRFPSQIGAGEIFGKGLCVGATMLIPGVSGGSMAMILNIYDRLILSVASFFREWKKNLLFLLLFSAGGMLGILLFAKPMLTLFERFPLPVGFFFLGAAAGGIPMIQKKSGAVRLTFPVFLALLAGTAAVLLYARFPLPEQTGGGTKHLLLYFLAGILAAAALVLPGISVSYMMLVMGLYEPVLQAVSKIELSLLLPFGAGLAAGTVLTAKLLAKAMARRPDLTYMVILGFMLGSIPELFPGIPAGESWFVCLPALAAGFCMMYGISRGEGQAHLKRIYDVKNVHMRS